MDKGLESVLRDTILELTRTVREDRFPFHWNRGKQIQHGPNGTVWEQSEGLPDRKDPTENRSKTLRRRKTETHKTSHVLLFLLHLLNLAVPEPPASSFQFHKPTAFPLLMCKAV